MSSEGFLGEVVDHLPEALVVAQDDGTIIYANQQFSAITGLAPEVLLGGDACRDAVRRGRPAVVGGELARGHRVRDRCASARPPPLGRRRRRLHPGGRLRSGIDQPAGGACHVGLVRKAQVELTIGASPATPGQAAASTSAGSPAAIGPTPSPLATGSTPATGPAVVELLDALDEGILMCDANGIVLIANRAARTLQGLPTDELLLGRPYPRATRLLTPDGTPLAGREYPLEQALLGTVVTGEQFVLDGMGDEPRHILASARPLAIKFNFFMCF